MVASRRVSEAEKLRIIRDAYNAIFWRPVPLDGDLAAEFVHLCGAILRGGKCEFRPKSPVALLFAKKFRKDHPVWRYILVA